MRNKSIQDFFILIKKAVNKPVPHGFLFFRIKPCHAIHINDILRPLPDGGKIAQKITIAKADDKRRGGNGGPVIERVKSAPMSKVFLIKLDRMCRYDVKRQGTLLPKLDLMKKLASRSPVKGRHPDYGQGREW